MWTEKHPHSAFFSHIWTLSSLCTHDVVAQGFARRVCIKHVHPHVITCLSVCCFLVLSSSSVSRASTLSHSSTCSLSCTSTPMLSRSPSITPNAHPQNKEYCIVTIQNPLAVWKVMQRNAWSGIASWLLKQLSNCTKSQLHALTTINSKRKNWDLVEKCQKCAHRLF